MAKIPLRAYNREIENLIDSGHTDEAIAHCRHILKTFPKYIETYRLLGKAFLETQRYTDASDILQRVLSSLPDDFVSHVGMSIIREDEGSLDQAIWHMERAFEIQPANGAIQEELRRLYGRRDGFEPPRVRLTRGALARMYLRGDLSQQAIAELRAALSEDPQRIDLQVLLAEAYARAGQRAEAADICNAVLKKLPFCLDALRVMTDILKNTERGEDTQVFRQRLGVLDPYALHTSAQTPTADRVPEQAITLERLEWSTSQDQFGKDAQPGWAASLGIKLENSENESLPDWMNIDSPSEADDPDAWSTAVTRGTGMIRPDQGGESENEEGESAADAPEWLASAAPPVEITPEDQIPDWMKDAGWGPSTGVFQEGPISFDDESEETAGEGGMFASDMPDWLREMAPELNDQQETVPEAEADEDFDWLNSSASPQVEAADWMAETDEPEVEKGEQPEVPDWLQSINQQEETGDPSSSLPDWLSEISSPVDKTQAIPNPMADTVPSWLQGLGDEAEEEPAEDEPAPTDATIPSWYQTREAEEVGEDETQLEEASPADLPEWMSELQPDEADVEVDEEPASEPAEIPDWLVELGVTEQAVPTGVEDMPVAGEQDLVSETDLAGEAEQLPAESTEPASSSPVDDDLNLWLASLDAGETPQMEEPAQQPEEAPASEWQFEAEPSPLDETQPVRTQVDLEPETEAPAEPAPREDADYDWLQDLSSEAALEAADLIETEAETSAQAEIEPEQPDWMQETLLTPPVEPEAVVEEESRLEEQPEAEELPEDATAAEAVEPTTLGEQEDFDASFAWLESLAVKQGATEALLLTPEERREEAPDWIEELTTVGDETFTSQDALTGDSVEEQPAAQEKPAAQEQPGEEAEAPVEDVGWFTPEDARVIEQAAELESASDALVDELLGAGEEMTAADTPADAEETSSESFELPDWLLEEEPVETDADTQPVRIPRQEAAEEQAPDLEQVAPEYEEITLEEPLDEEAEPAGQAQLEAEAQPEVEAQSEAEEQPEVQEQPEAQEQAEAAPPEAAEQPAYETDLTSQDADFAWLESLAVKQGASEALLLTPEERRETPPDWVEDLTGEETPVVDQTELELEAENLLDQVTQEFPTGQPEESDAAAEEQPFDEAHALAETQISRPADLDEELAAAEVPTWLLEDEQEAPPDEEDTKPVRRAQAGTEPSADTPDADFAWLESLAVRQDASEALLLTPEERGGVPPDWVDEGEEGAEGEAAAEAEAAPQAYQAEPGIFEGEAQTIEEMLQELEEEELPAEPEPQEMPEISTSAEEAVPAVEESQPASEPESAAPEMPDLPDWLAGVESTDKLDWTPPPVPEKLVRQLDLNLASLAELERLPGVGFRLAQAIVNHRETYGPFKQVNDLFEVRGFSQATLDFIHDRVYVEGPAEPTPQEPGTEAAFQPSEISFAGLPEFDGEAPPELVAARDALLAGNVDESLAGYNRLIRSRQNLPVIISDLQSAVQRTPGEPRLWQALGDAHMRLDHLQEALNAYTKAEDLLR
jgi:competence ComEA-like helix-hairpin-helix protein